MTDSASDSARQVRLLIIDIDGVLTDGGLQFDNRGEEYKTFNSLDGHGIRMMLENGIEVAVITGRKSEIVEHRMRDLGVRQIYQGYRDKLPAFEKLLQDCGTSFLRSFPMKFFVDVAFQALPEDCVEPLVHPMVH